MGIAKPYQLETLNGQLIETNLFDSLSILRTPEKREEILKGQFHKVTAPDGTGEITIEKPFLYTDFQRNEVILVKPPSERYTWQKTSAELEQVVKQLPRRISAPETLFKRVVFGLGELREKLVIRSQGIDDRIIELFKVLLIYEHPIILLKPHLNIYLRTIDSQSLTFIASYEQDKKAYEISVPRQLADDLLSQPDKLKQWVAVSHKDNFFEPEKSHAHWVSFRRWLPTETTPNQLFDGSEQSFQQKDIVANRSNFQTTLQNPANGNDISDSAKKASNQLFDYAEQARQKKDIDTTSPAFQTMLKDLRSGNNIILSDSENQALHDLFVWAGDRGNRQLQDKLLGVRFHKQLNDAWYLTKDSSDMDTLWKVLQNLPDTNVEGNTNLHEIDLGEGQGGGWSSGNTISIGSTNSPMDNVIRHEVGHQVQADLDQAKQNLVNNWLQSQFGWKTFGLSDSEIDAWVNLMGGYGNITAQQQQEVRQYLRDSSKKQPQPSNVPSDHPWYFSNFGPRLALEQTGDPLWENYHQWYRANGLAFYRDYDYGFVTAVTESTLNFVEQNMPSSYALRSAVECFAELYALFYDLADLRWGNIPQSLRDWLWDNIGSSVPIPMRYYIIRNKQSRQMINVSQVSQENGAQVIQWTENGNVSNNELWLLEDMENGYYTLTAKHSGKVLDVPSSSTKDGTQIQQYEKNGTDAQQWKLEETEDGYYILLSKVSGMALTVGGNPSQNGSPIQQQANRENDIQKWRFELALKPGKSLFIGPFGGTGGGVFKDGLLPDGAKICKVRVRHGAYLDAIGLSYKLNGQVIDLPMHGGNGGELSEFALEDDEYITSLSGRYDQFVYSLVIHTNKRTSSQYGDDRGFPNYILNIQHPNQELVGFLGRSGAWLDAIGVVLVDKGT